MPRAAVATDGTGRRPRRILPSTARVASAKMRAHPMRSNPLRTSVIGSYPFPGWLELASVQLDDGDFFRPLAAIYKKGKVLSPAVKQFLSILKEA